MVLIITQVVFFKTEMGNEPVREWLKSLNILERKIIGEDLQTIQLGWRSGLVKEPLVKNLGAGLFEMRTILSSSHRIARIFFCLYEQNIVLLHALIKKTQKKPMNELTLARKRLKLLKG